MSYSNPRLESAEKPQAILKFSGVAIMAASIWITVVGVAALLVLPLIVGAISDYSNFTEGQIGFLASADMAGMGLLSSLSIFWVRKVNWRVASAVGLIILIIGNVLSVGQDNFGTMLMLRFIAGMGGGIALSVGLACQSDCRLADRAFSIFVAMEFFLTSIGFLVLPRLIEQYGLPGITYTLAAMGLSALLVCGFLPSRGLDKSIQAGGENKVPVRGILVLVGCLLFFTSQGGLWAFIERIGVEAGLGTGAVGTVLAITSYAGLVGALGAAFLKNRVGYFFAFLLVGFCELIGMLLLLGDISYISFFFSLILYQSCWALAIPLMMSTVNDMDHSGKLVLLVLAVAKLGYAIGPALLGQLLEGGSFTLGIYASMLLCSLGVIIIAKLVNVPRP
ncbi:MFS transporter [Dasania marina]|uniref:MFS transporter n=1 Tax=Dasania marina TaxID=471499 RepID=UPI0030DCF564|tara:strand:+ start:15051 stop:16226 length:1176 start_codon:yes stop_codon:yes gene_type:complete